MSNARIYGLMYSGKRSFRCWKSDEKGPVAAVITIEWTSPSAASAEIEAEWAIQRSLSREVSLVIATRFCNCGRHGAYILSWRKAGHFFKSVRSKLYYETSAQVASKSEAYEKRLRVIFIFVRYLSESNGCSNRISSFRNVLPKWRREIYYGTCCTGFLVFSLLEKLKLFDYSTLFPPNQDSRHSHYPRCRGKHSTILKIVPFSRA